MHFFNDISQAHWQKLAEKYYGNSAAHYRSMDFEMSGLDLKGKDTGWFTYCGCYFKECKFNTATSQHACGFCAHRLQGFCLAEGEEGQYGVCRRCFISKCPPQLAGKPPACPPQQAAPNTFDSQETTIFDLTGPQGVQTANTNTNALEVKLKEGIIEIKTSTYEVDELALLKEQDEATLKNNLFTLVCSLAIQSFEDGPNGNGKSHRKTTRYQLYAIEMENVFKNYPTTTHGSIILTQLGFVDAVGKPIWPSFLLAYYYDWSQDCRDELEKWLATGKCPLTQEQIGSLHNEELIEVYKGYKIDAVVDSTEKFANHTVNKHWPSVFKSGESPSALLQNIRNWYFCDVERPKRARSQRDAWVSRQQKKKIVVSSAAKNAKVLELSNGMVSSLVR